MMKGEGESISLQIRGDGPIGNIVSVANPKGDVKGYVKIRILICLLKPTENLMWEGQ